MRRALLATVFLLAAAAVSSAQPAVFIVRHAERTDTGTAASKMMGADPDLSEAGKARAEALATVLKDARITAIHATDYKRTAQTAAPLAKALGLGVTVTPSKDVRALVEKLKSAEGNVLVVGHSNSVPAVIKALGIPEPVSVSEEDFDNLFVVIRSATPTLLRLHYR